MDFVGCIYFVFIFLFCFVYGECLNQVFVFGISLSCCVKEISCDKDYEEMFYIYVVNEGGVYYFFFVVSSVYYFYMYFGVYF